MSMLERTPTGTATGGCGSPAALNYEVEGISQSEVRPLAAASFWRRGPHRQINGRLVAG